VAQHSISLVGQIRDGLQLRQSHGLPEPIPKPATSRVVAAFFVPEYPVEIQRQVGSCVISRKKVGQMSQILKTTALALCAASAFFLLTFPASAEKGVWVGAKEFSHINIVCVRVYTCGPKDSMIYSADKKLSVTPPVSIRGVCAAGSGPIDSCNLCLTNPPSTSCEWKVVPK
jgi:hypothetical protein